jgi:hypothetical protein
MRSDYDAAIAYYEESAVARLWILLAGVWVGLVGGNGTLAPAQDVGAGTSANAGKSAAAAAPVKKTCMVNSIAPSPAETALSRKEYSSAESLFRAVLAKSPSSDPVHEGLVRALIEQNKVTDAAKDAEAWVTAEPGNSLALVALGDVRLRQGDTTEISHGAGVEVSGLIGAPALFQVVMHIDYRDNLVWCEYTAKQ